MRKPPKAAFAAELSQRYKSLKASKSAYSMVNILSVKNPGYESVFCTVPTQSARFNADFSREVTVLYSPGGVGDVTVHVTETTFTWKCVHLRASFDVNRKTGHKIAKNVKI